jgi:hypothetical protein
MYTKQFFEDLNPKKIHSVKKQIGLLASTTVAKVFINRDVYYVLTRTGFLNYMGDAQRACIYGKKNIDFKEFKTAQSVSNYINKLI